MKKQRRNRVWTVIIILVILFLVSVLVSNIISFFSGFSSSDNEFSGEGNVALIPLKGVLGTDENSGFAGVQGSASSSKIVKQLEEAASNSDIKAIVLEIDSPGGSGVAADEIVSVMNDIKQNKTIVAWIREEGASAAYWVSTAANHSIANRMSLTGSIGVMGSYIEYAGLMDHFNVTYRRLVSGKYKDAGSPFRQLTPEEQQLMQSLMDKMYEMFIKDVAKYRHLDVKEVRKLATGEVFLGGEAKDLGLIDEVGGKKEVVHYLESNMNITVQMVESKEKKSVLELLRNLQSQSMVRSPWSNLLFIDQSLPSFS